MSIPINFASHTFFAEKKLNFETFRFILQITPATSYAGTTAEIVNLNPQAAGSGNSGAETSENPDLLSQLRPLDDEIRLALLNKASTSRKIEDETPPQVPRRSTSYDIFTNKPAMPKLSPPTPFADEDTFPHIIPPKKVNICLKWLIISSFMYICQLGGFCGFVLI